ncbi:Methyltransferase domain-containing protein [Tistlia consotensis]|uniref:Phosphoethanolamine N-methyltransferase n=1 Tax=Tistlia consotensis USBA 355 TaxID=560819 RepID=A0A1Y6BMX2_9PROT|nr:methyltransferase domain-containing protein [Tistlia consotensis]SMF17850.1 phosphoethanolamine N-methyltransferase [Tistlia consotensis USBA 355]SNR40087.1 Methyltransferase domain-containing protein [Tistlia consotensis]
MTGGEPEYEYGDDLVGSLAIIWGEGFLSPGGPEEVARLLEGTDLTGATVLDIGCGVGGVDLVLARDYHAGKVVGIDIEPPLVEKARALAEKYGLSDRIELRAVEPGPLPFADASFDAVFSKDSLIHIADKDALFAEVFRVCRAGGLFVASDWLRNSDDPPSPEMARYIESEGLSFGMASPERYRRALERAGFVGIELVNRNPWYREVARRELAALEGELGDRLARAVSPEMRDKNVAIWRNMQVVLDSGEHCPTHIKAKRP